MQRSIIQYIRKLYTNDLIGQHSKIFSELTSCEFTTLLILDYLGRMKLINKPLSSDFTKGDVIPIKSDTIVVEVILFRRSHTFLIVKENKKVYMVSAYLNKYRSHIDEINDDLDVFLQKIYMTEFEDDVKLHKDLFKVDKVPCLTLDKSLSKIKINVYEVNDS